MALVFSDPLTASLKVPLALNSQGQIATSSDTPTGTKTFTFSYVTPTASANAFIYGTDEATAESSTTGIVETLITYLLDASADLYGLKRTLINGVVED